jgi:hypothetical protein
VAISDVLDDTRMRVRLVSPWQENGNSGSQSCQFCPILRSILDPILQNRQNHQIESGVDSSILVPDSALDSVSILPIPVVIHPTCRIGHENRVRIMLVRVKSILSRFCVVQ